MPYKSEEKRKEWEKQYYRKNKERISIYCKKWYRRTYKERAKYRERMKEPRKQLDARRNKEIREIILRHYCKNNKIKCELHKTYFPNDNTITDTRILVIDHINGGGCKQKRELGVQGAQFYRWLMKHNFPKGYQIICHNCNWIKKWEQNEVPRGRCHE